MNTSLLTYFITGAAINFIVEGEPAEVAATVNKLYNFGVVTNIPDTYKENESGKVIVQSDRGRTERGFMAMAEMQLRGSMRAVSIRSRRNWKSLWPLAIQADALAMMQSIERVPAFADREASTFCYQLGVVGAD